MTKVLLITNVVVGLLVIADMLYGRAMAKKWMSDCECSMDIEEDLGTTYSELELRDEVLEQRITILEEKVNKLKPKRTSKPKTTKRKKK